MFKKKNIYIYTSFKYVVVYQKSRIFHSISRKFQTCAFSLYNNLFPVSAQLLETRVMLFIT